MKTKHEVNIENLNLLQQLKNRNEYKDYSKPLRELLVSRNINALNFITYKVVLLNDVLIEPIIKNSDIEFFSTVTFKSKKMSEFDILDQKDLLQGFIYCIEQALKFNNQNN